MLSQSIQLSAGQTVKFNDLGNFIRILKAIDPITVRTYKNGQVKTESSGVFSGYAEQFENDDAFEAVEIYSATAQTVDLVVRYGQIVYYDQAPSGNVMVTTLTPTQATGESAQATVTNASTQLVAQNAARKYLLIQNNDTSGVVYVAVGVAATLTNGIKIPAGGSYELNCNVLTGQINAIGSLALNANIVVVTG